MQEKEIFELEKSDDWNRICILENNEPLISINSLSNKKIISKPKYFQQGMEGSLNDCYVREGVALRLVEASKSLPSEYNFIILDGWRPYAVQEHLYNTFKNHLIKQFPELNEDQINQRVKLFVSKPSKNINSPAPHSTGGSIDITIGIGQNELYMGTKFDEFSIMSNTRYFEENKPKTKKGLEALKNRRLLFHLLVSAGFSNYSEEWWHFDYGNQWWASTYNKRSAKYGLASIAKDEK